jgi:hypothetical protein
MSPSPSIWRHGKTGLPANVFCYILYWRFYQIFQPNLDVVKVGQHNTLHKNYLNLRAVWILLGWNKCFRSTLYRMSRHTLCVMHFFKSHAIYVIITWNTTVPDRRFTNWVIKKKYKHVVRVLVCSQIENLHNKSTVLPCTW